MKNDHLEVCGPLGLWPWEAVWLGWQTVATESHWESTVYPSSVLIFYSLDERLNIDKLDLTFHSISYLAEFRSIHNINPIAMQFRENKSKAEPNSDYVNTVVLKFQFLSHYWRVVKSCKSLNPNMTSIWRVANAFCDTPITINLHEDTQNMKDSLSPPLIRHFKNAL